MKLSNLHFDFAELFYFHVFFLFSDMDIKVMDMVAAAAAVGK